MTLDSTPFADRIGRDRDQEGRFLSADYAELMVYTRVLTADELNRIGWYLQQKYGIAASYTQPVGPTPAPPPPAPTPTPQPDIAVSLAEADFGGVELNSGLVPLNLVVRNVAAGAALNIITIDPIDLPAGASIVSVVRNAAPLSEPYIATLRGSQMDLLFVRLAFDTSVGMGEHSGSFSIVSDDPDEGHLVIPVRATVVNELGPPVPVQNGLVLHLDANAIVGATNNAPLTAWTDRSPERNNAMSTSAESAPTYVQNALNGKPVVRFNGTSSVMNFAGVPNIRTVFWVIKENDAEYTSNWRTILSGGENFHRGADHLIYSGQWTAEAVRNGTTQLNGAVIDATATRLQIGRASCRERVWRYV